MRVKRLENIKLKILSGLTSMRTKLTLILLIVTIIPLIIMRIASSSYLKSVIENDFMNSAAKSIDQIDKTVNIYFGELKNFTSLLSGEELLRNAGESLTDYSHMTGDASSSVSMEPRPGKELAIFKRLSQYIDANKGIFEAFMSSEENSGYIQYPPSSRAPGFDPKKEVWYKMAMDRAGEVIVLDPEVKANGKVSMLFVKSVKDLTSQTTGVVGMNISLSQITKIIIDSKIGETGYIMLLDKKGTILADARNPQNVLKKLSEIELGKIKDVADIKEGELTEVEINGIKHFALGHVSTDMGLVYIAIIEQEELQSSIARLSLIQSVIMLLLAVLIIGVSVFTVNKVTKPLFKSIEHLNEMGAGDFSKKLPDELLTRKDEIGTLVRSLILMEEKVKGVINKVVSSADTLVLSSESISKTMRDISEGTQNQAAASEEITASVEEISAGMDHVAVSARDQYDRMNGLISEMNDLSRMINEMGVTIRETMVLTGTIETTAKKGEKSLQTMNESMNKITASSKDMERIVNIITEIAEKINLLSLNAAIEAARAGDSGRGFAVVSDEISKLADETTNSIKEISNLIDSSNKEIVRGIATSNETVDTITAVISGVEDINRRMEKVSSLTVRQVEANSLVNDEADKVKIRADEIRSSTEEQKIGTMEIVKSISSLTLVAQTQASGSEEVSVSATDIQKMAESLKSQVAFFKIKSE